MTAMTPDDFRAARQALGLTQNACAARLGIASGRTIRRWEKGQREIDPPAARLLADLVALDALRERTAAALAFTPHRWADVIAEAGQQLDAIIDIKRKG